ncbi:hypothetical protein MKW92_051823 [Papaver armeniacum]|nr:hypothetical protein MKW92_051823 [Papaver armeniacum]
MMRTVVFSEIVIFLFLLLLIQTFADHGDNDNGIYYNGFKDHFLKFDGKAQVDPDTGLLRLTDLEKDFEQGRAFYSLPFLFKGNFSFSTTFVFAIVSEYGPNLLSGQGMAFVIAPQRGLPGAFPNQFLGIFNDTNNGRSENRVFSVELDGSNNIEFDTVPGPHVDSMYVGFAAATQTYHYILGWSFQIDDTAQALNLSSLPKLPHPTPKSASNKKPNMVIIASAVGGSILVLALLVILCICYLRKPNRNNIPVVRASSPPPVAGLQKFKYSELKEAKNVFKEQIGKTDAYAFGAFLLEVACGRRPNLVAARGLHLVDWVLSSMKENVLLSTVDKKLGGEYAEAEMLLVLNLGLLCCRFDPTARPTVQKILQFLSGDAAEADLRALHMSDEPPVRHVGGGSTSPLSGTQIGSTSSGNDPQLPLGTPDHHLPSTRQVHQ